MGTIVQGWAKRGDSSSIKVRLSSTAVIAAYQSLDGVPSQIHQHAITSLSNSHARAFKYAFEKADRGGYKEGTAGKIKGQCSCMYSSIS